jgi:light-regulated signal transduction histidine kinase (bacteriophytochrome)
MIDFTVTDTANINFDKHNIGYPSNIQIIESLISPMGREQQQVKISDFSLDNSYQETTDPHETHHHELETLSYSISHDLRAPLRAIQNNYEWLRTKHADQLDSDGQALLQQIGASSGYMEKLLDGLLELSRAASLDYKFSMIDMTALVRGVIDELLKNDRGSSPLLISIKPLPPAYADELLMHQVWYNLLSNAFKYTRYQPNRKVEIDSYQLNTCTVYCVSDNGVGFDMHYADHLFGAFHRLHETEKFEGTGIGLAIVRQIIRRHHGRVWADGKADNGAQFYFALPNIKR